MSMRKILFRGKQKRTGTWVYGNLQQDPAMIVVNDVKNAFVVGSRFFEVDPETVGQYIGLEDSEGRMIFEGDILGYKGKEITKEMIEDAVHYGEFNCSCCDGVYGWSAGYSDIRQVDILVVLGNIHDITEAKNE